MAKAREALHYMLSRVKTFILERGYSDSESSMSLPLKISSSVLVVISSMSVSICNRFHATLANSGKITVLNKGTLL